MKHVLELHIRKTLHLKLSFFSPHKLYVLWGKKAVVSNMSIFNYLSSTDKNVRAKTVFNLLFVMQIGDQINDT